MIQHEGLQTGEGVVLARFSSPYENLHRGFFSVSLLRCEVPFLQIPEIKTLFFHIYMPYILYNMRIHRFHHYNLHTYGFVLKIKKWRQVSMLRHKIHDP